MSLEAPSLAPVRRTVPWALLLQRCTIPALYHSIPLCRQLQAMSAAHVEAVQAYLAPLSSGNGPWADPERVHIAAADLALSLALVAECGPAAAATGPELHGLFAALVRLGPPVRYATGWAGLCAQMCCAPAVVCLLPWSGLALKGHTYFP